MYFNFFNLIIAMLASVLFLASMRGEQTYEKYKSLSNSSAVLSARVSRLQKASKDLETEINKIKNSPEYAAKIFKGTYNDKEEGEEMVTFFD